MSLPQRKEKAKITVVEVGTGTMTTTTTTKIHTDCRVLFSIFYAFFYTVTSWRFFVRHGALESVQFKEWLQGTTAAPVIFSTRTQSKINFCTGIIFPLPQVTQW